MSETECGGEQMVFGECGTWENGSVSRGIRVGVFFYFNTPGGGVEMEGWTQ